MARPVEQRREVFELKLAGLRDSEVSTLTGVPVATIRTWRRRETADPALRGAGDECAACARCGSRPHDFEALPVSDYAYLLGLYLGDGSIRRWGRGWTLRISLDTAYTGIIEECRSAVASVRGGEPAVRSDYCGKKCVHVESSWRSWPCLLPQHGRGRKHHRRIELTDWQQRTVDQAPGRFLRGLIHTDGWRGVNRVTAKGREYEYPRYQFSNRSDDIRRLFTDACDALGVEWRPWTRFHVSVAKRGSVAILDREVGPKR